MYTDITAEVKWSGDASESLNIEQGVHTGGILSTHFYKYYNNNLLLDLELQSLRKIIGKVYTCFPTCTDDVLLM